MEIENILKLSRMILAFGQVFRVTEDRDGRPESDTTHTLMLALLAGELAPKEVVPLDRQLVVLFSLVHDLAEVYAGDTSTLRLLSGAAQIAKDERERIATEKIREELAAFPWILDLMARYEAQIEPEARFVKYLDKVLPKLTHRDNQLKVPRQTGMTHAEFLERHRSQSASLAARYPEMTFAASIFESACRDSEQCWPEPKKNALATGIRIAMLPMKRQRPMVACTQSTATTNALEANTNRCPNPHCRSATLMLFFVGDARMTFIQAKDGAWVEPHERVTFEPPETMFFCLNCEHEWKPNE